MSASSFLSVILAQGDLILFTSRLWFIFLLSVPIVCVSINRVENQHGVSTLDAKKAGKYFPCAVHSNYKLNEGESVTFTFNLHRLT